MNSETIITIIVSSITAFAVVLFASWLSISFDKQGAAEQFSLEITSMNESLQSYASIYTHNYDIVCEGNPVPDINSKNTVILLLDDSSIPYELKINNHSIFTIKGYPDYVSDDRRLIGHFYHNPQDPDFTSCSLSRVYLPPSLYNEHGMYYSYIRDIPKFDADLAKNIDIFYNDITTAEANRQYLQNYFDVKSVDSPYRQAELTQNQYFSAYMEMRKNIMNASELEPVLIQELNNENKNSLDLRPFQLSSTGSKLNQELCWPFAPVSCN